MRYLIITWLFAALVHAGNFINTCSTIVLDDDYHLHAECSSKSGVRVPSQLDLDLCFSQDGGALVLKSKGGDTVSTCPLCALHADPPNDLQLLCHCSTNLQEYTHIDLTTRMVIFPVTTNPRTRNIHPLPHPEALHIRAESSIRLPLWGELLQVPSYLIRREAIAGRMRDTRAAITVLVTAKTGVGVSKNATSGKFAILQKTPINASRCRASPLGRKVMCVLLA
ncbi:CVNH domain-containing protein [Aspergillus lucknowensis]|uniref:Cyanovirin-N domain-containing protein n=1 Tax=Aspergillus lucknowensis TaxID=176173 RepID=A0ABR4L3H2_9EURO